MGPLSYNVWLSSACEWYTPGHRIQRCPHLNLQISENLQGMTSEAIRGREGIAIHSEKMSRASFEVSKWLHLWNIRLLFLRCRCHAHANQGLRWICEIVLIGNLSSLWSACISNQWDFKLALLCSWLTYCYNNNNNNNNNRHHHHHHHHHHHNSVALARDRTIPTERLPVVGKVSNNFCG
jgi:hypothetical protein